MAGREVYEEEIKNYYEQANKEFGTDFKPPVHKTAEK